MTPMIERQLFVDGAAEAVAASPLDATNPDEICLDASDDEA